MAGGAPGRGPRDRSAAPGGAGAGPGPGPAIVSLGGRSQAGSPIIDEPSRSPNAVPSAVQDLKVFVPAQDFEASKAFYEALGGRINWQHEATVAEIQLGGSRFLLQNYYVEAWAANFMIHVLVADVAPWAARVAAMERSGRFPGMGHQGPVDEPWGQRVLYVHAPGGVLLHVAQDRA